MNAAVDRRTTPGDRARSARVWLELRHGRLRLALAENELAWAQQALDAGHIPPETALAVLDAAFDDLAGAQQ